MKINELIKELEIIVTNSGDLEVAYQLHSENKLMIMEDIQVKRLHPARKDGWIHDYWRDGDIEDKLKVSYLVFPGN